MVCSLWSSHDSFRSQQPAVPRHASRHMCLYVHFVKVQKGRKTTPEFNANISGMQHRIMGIEDYQPPWIVAKSPRNSCCHTSTSGASHQCPQYRARCMPSNRDSHITSGQSFGLFCHKEGRPGAVLTTLSGVNQVSKKANASIRGRDRYSSAHHTLMHISQVKYAMQGLLTIKSQPDDSADLKDEAVTLM